MVFVDVRLEMGAAAGFVEAGCSYDDEFLALAESLGMDGGLAAGHADGGEFGDLVGERHEVRDGAERFVGKGGVEAGEDDALAEVDELKGELDDVVVEELDLVDADDVDFVNFAGGEEVFAQPIAGRGDSRGVVRLRAMAGDGGAVVAEIDVGLVTGDALAGDAGSLESADEFLRFTGKHGACDDLDAA